jgi:predicted cation transporter
MITAFIFFAHFLFALIIFTKKWQEENLSAAFLNLGLIGILFAVGWSVVGIATQNLLSPKGLGIYFDRDAITLTILSAAEFFFYRFYYKKDKNTTTEAGMEKQ